MIRRGSLTLLTLLLLLIPQVGETQGTGAAAPGTVIGEVVNVAARVEALTRRFDAEILITAETCGRLRHADRSRSTILTPLGPQALKGVGRQIGRAHV